MFAHNVKMNESLKKIQTAAKPLVNALAPVKRFFTASSLPRIILLIVAVLVVLSLISRSCKCKSENFDNLRTVDSYLPNYIVDVQRNCLPGEVDTERWCIKQGCPEGMERGSGSGSELCYAKCLDGYDSNGMSRCYKKCPEGFQTNETTCANPGHTFLKDIVPCKGCINRLSGPSGPYPILSPAQLPIPMRHPSAPVIMTPNTSADWRVTNLLPEAVIWTSFIEDFDGAAIQGGSGPSSLNSSSQKTDSSGGVSETTIRSQASPALPGNIATIPIAALADPSRSHISQVSTPSSTIPTKVTINLSEKRIDSPTDPCPRGYTLSGDKCYENCPPTYRDTNNGECVKKSYTIDRDSYDRGSGIPYITRRPKYDQIFHT